MSKLDKDVLFLIIEELADDGKSLHSCLLVNRTWCEATIPSLWRNPLKFCIKKEILFDVIYLHLSEDSREKIRSYIGDESSKEILNTTYRQTLFNYISHW